MGTSQRFEVVPIITSEYRKINRYQLSEGGIAVIGAGTKRMSPAGTPITKIKVRIPLRRPKASLRYPMKKTRVLIVDDHTLVRDGIRALLELVADVEVVGEATNGKEALEKVKELFPDIVLMDLSMPVMSGLEATRRIRREHPEIKVLALTQYDDADYVVPVIEAGAQGFITKMSAFSELATAIQAVYSGESYLSPSAATALVEEFQVKRGAEVEKDHYQKLTNREREVL